MAYVTPTTRSDGYVVPASEWNQNAVDNPIALRTGGVAIASQATGDVIAATSASQLGRVAPGATGTALMSNGTGVAPSFERVMRVLNRSAGDVSNSGTTETDLKTYTLPAAMLSTNGDSIRIVTSGVMAANANTKTFRVYFGATIVATAVSTLSGSSWKMVVEITRTAAATQIACGVFSGQATGDLFTTTAPAETLSGTVVVKLTGQSNVASTDITAKNWAVEFLPNA